MKKVQVTLVAVATSLAFSFAGCDSWEKPSAKSAEPGPATPSANATADAEPSLEMLLASFESAKAEHDAQPADAKLKQRFVDTAISYADALTYRQGGVPSEKYPKALAIYDSVLVVDAKNERAMAGKQIILDIYKSLGKAPPKADS
jgi:hypothetical protein